MRPARLMTTRQDYATTGTYDVDRFDAMSGGHGHGGGIDLVVAPIALASSPFRGGFDAEANGPNYALNADDRGDVGPNNKQSFTAAEAAAQIGRANQTWNGSGVLGQATTITYAFRSSAPATMPDDTAGFTRFNAAQVTQTQRALQSWSDVGNITFNRQAGTDGYSNSAQMLFGNYSSGADGAAAFAYYPGGGVGGDVWVNSSISYNQNPTVLNYGRHTLTHEVGHALGLGHPGDYNAGTGSPTYANSAVYYEDTRQYTLMSYWSEANTGGSNAGSYAAAPLVDDIAAIQRLYGANTATRTGDDVYGFNSNTGRDFYSTASSATPVIFAVWDAGGVDTLDFSGYTQTQRIDLNDGAFSNVGGLTGNVAIAVGVAVENAFGGSGVDTMIGNELTNTLRGNAGNDVLDGNAGADALHGGTGADRFVFDQLSDSRSGAVDRIHDFASGSDRIDLSVIDARSNVAGNQAFTIASSFTGVSGQLIGSYSSATGLTTISADVNGDRVADFVLHVNGQMTGADLIL